jgi:hypothetical protein
MAQIPYKSVIGSLFYAMVCTQLDIAYFVGVVSHYLVNPKVTHRFAIKRIMNHLIGFSIHGLIYKGKSHLNPLPKTNIICHGHSNIDWVGDIDIRKSTSRYFLKFYP